MASESALWGHEFDFLATDVDGFTAVLSTAGYGPVPVEVAARVKVEDSLVDLLGDLSPVCSAVVEVVDRGDTSFWEKIAERGVYTFDWQVWDGPYRRVCLPSEPILADDHPFDLSGAVILPVRFSEVVELDLANLAVECDE